MSFLVNVFEVLVWGISATVEGIDYKIRKESVEKINKSYYRYINAINNHKCGLCVLVSVFFFSFIVFLLDIQNVWQWTIFSISILLGVFLCLPLIRRILAYQRFLDCLILANVVKETVIELDYIAIEISKKNKLKKSGIKTTSLSVGEFISPECLKRGNEVWAWINMNKKYFGAEQQKRLKSIYSNYQDNVKNYIKEIGVFYHDYDQNIVSGIYQDGFVPPMPYTDKDISSFNHFQLTDMN